MATFTTFQPIMRPGVDPASAPNKPPLPPLGYDRREEQDLVIERNIGVPLRDGITIYADLYRPRGAAGEADLPLLLAWGPYGKHGLTNQVFWPLSGVNPEWLSTLTPFEGPDPVWWGSRGYAVAVVDPRGAWQSEGDFHHNGLQEAEDCYDTIQWFADQAWSNGKVGMTGVSYLAAIQYYVAPLKPPALVAINPWEAFSDWYREFAYHGGIPETGFIPRASDNIRFSLGRTEDTWANVQAHPLIDDYWRSKDIPLEEIDIPAYVVASWSDQGLHLRGTIEAWRRMGSAKKWLDVHGQKKWAHYYMDQSRERRLAFFDHYLKGKTTQVSQWPPVRIEVRDQAGSATERAEGNWPLERTEYRPLWLDAGSGTLSRDKPSGESKARYESESGRATFDIVFDEDTEFTGHMKLRLWVEIEEGEDADLFVAAQKLDADGQHTGFTFYAFYENGPVALGWLRASHRQLDTQRSQDWRPVHTHTQEDLLTPGEAVPVDIELWPSSTRFRAGETLRIVVQGSDIYTDSKPNLPFARHENLRNSGHHVIHTGGRYDSHLLAPIIPE